jgi:hypothetical protein
MDFITYLQQQLTAYLPEVMAGYEGEIRATSLSEMEVTVKKAMHEVGNKVLTEWIAAQEDKYPAARQGCGCGKQAQYIRRRPGMVITLQGRVYYRRAYYLCESCGTGHYPLDERLGIEPGQMSREVVKVAALCGVQDAFEAGSDLLARTSLLELSPNSLRKACQVVGEQVMNHEGQAQARRQDLAAQLEQRRVPNKPTRLYGSMDGFYVLLEDGYHEMKAGAWWTTRTRRNGEVEADQIQYYVDLLPAEDFADLVWASGFARHADQALELVFIADGAEWIWRIVSRLYPHAIQIVDWYHACTYLTTVAADAFSDQTLAQAWLAQQQTALWEGHLATVFRACRAVSSQAPQTVRDALSYFAHNRTRLRYAKFRARGLQIGSGSMESGCKQIGLERLKIAGARWSEEGARKVAKARAAYLSGQWDKVTASAAVPAKVA